VFDWKTVAVPEATCKKATPSIVSVDNVPRQDSISGPFLVGASTAEFWFLHITWTLTPVGLLLWRREDGIFERVGLFKMGRDNYQSGVIVW